MKMNKNTNDLSQLKPGDEVWALECDENDQPDLSGYMFLAKVNGYVIATSWINSMTRFTRYTLCAAALILIAAATASAITYAYHWRGYFSIGGEVLIPAVVAIIWAIGREIKRIIRKEKEENERSVYKSDQ